MKTKRTGWDSFAIPKDVRTRAREATKKGVRFVLTPDDLITWMDWADAALNSVSNHQPRQALLEIRENISEIYENPKRLFFHHMGKELEKMFKDVSR